MGKSQTLVMSKQEVRDEVSDMVYNYVNGDKTRLEFLAKKLGVSTRMIYAYMSGVKLPNLVKYYELLLVVNS